MNLLVSVNNVRYFKEVKLNNILKEVKLDNILKEVKLDDILKEVKLDDILKEVKLVFLGFLCQCLLSKKKKSSSLTMEVKY